jgi:hypothetical protein
MRGENARLGVEITGTYLVFGVVSPIGAVAPQWGDGGYKLAFWICSRRILAVGVDDAPASFSSASTAANSF